MTSGNRLTDSNRSISKGSKLVIVGGLLPEGDDRGRLEAIRPRRSVLPKPNIVPDVRVSFPKRMGRGHTLIDWSGDRLHLTAITCGKCGQDISGGVGEESDTPIHE